MSQLMNRRQSVQLMGASLAGLVLGGKAVATPKLAIVGSVRIVGGLRPYARNSCEATRGTAPAPGTRIDAFVDGSYYGSQTTDWRGIATFNPFFVSPGPHRFTFRGPEGTVYEVWATA